MEGLIILGLLIYILVKHFKKHKTKSRNFKVIPKKENEPNYYETGWTWNNEKQLWEHPSSQKIQGSEPKQEINEEPAIRETTIEEPQVVNLAKEYQSKYLFTKNEWYQYKKLKEIADIREFVVCPKVRLLDIIEPKKGTPNYMACLGKIKSKHVDFVICDLNMHIKAIIELDDNSHDTEKGKERDRFVNQVLSNVGYKVIRTRYINSDILDSV